MSTEQLQFYFEKIWASDIEKIVISKAASKNEAFRKVVGEWRGEYFQIAKYTEKQVFHENIISEQVALRCCELTEGHFLQVNAWNATQEQILLISKKGKLTYKVKQRTDGISDKVKLPSEVLQKADLREESSHNRKKNYILEEGYVIAPLVDMGIFTKDGKVVKAMYDKFRQINRFLEILDDAIDGLKTKELNVIDFGCGKSYLTFIVYDYLTRIKGISTQIVGLDLKKDVIEKCNLAAKKYGYSGLRFELGDINGYKADFDVDMVMTLHACDTATDYALYNAVQWKARMIFSVPCCQHELNRQMQPKNLRILSHYGIIKERFAALATDAIRGNLLEYCGYKTQLLEFVDFEHTPKNILIRAVRRPMTPKALRERAIEEVETLKEELGVEPTLYRLLEISKEEKNG